MALNRIAIPEFLGEELSKEALWLFVIFLFSFQLFDGFPFVKTVHLAEMPIFLFLIIFALFHFGRGVYEKRSLSRAEILLVCLLCIPVISAVSAWLSFGQPIWMGLLAERRWFRVIAGLYVFQKLLSHQINWKIIHCIFLFLAFGFLLIYVSIWLFLQPDSLAGGFFFMDVPSKGLRLGVTPIFVIWGAIYFVLRWFRSNNMMSRFVNSVVAAVMLGYVVFIYKSRASIVVLVAVLICMAVIKAKKGRRIRTLMALLLPAVTMAGVMWIVKPQMVRRQLSGFYSIATSISGGDGEMDASFTNRISQGTVAWWSTSRSTRTLIFGNGRLSRHWEGEEVESFGHFFPVDIGWLGIVFLYGFFGFVLVNVSFLMAWNLSRKNTCRNEDVFLDSLKWWLVYLFFRSVFNGVVVSNPALVLVSLFLISWRCWQNTQDLPIGNEKECEL